MNTDKIDMEMMGIELSRKVHYNGVDILRVAAAALENANFHDECEVVLKMITALESASDTPRYELTVDLGDSDDLIPVTADSNE